MPVGFLALLAWPRLPGRRRLHVAALAMVPMTDKPDDHLVFSNDSVNAYNIKIAPNSSTLVHQHLHDNVFIVFGDADVTNSIEGKIPVQLNLKDSSVNFGRAPYAHQVRNNGTLPFRNIIVELLQSQGDAKKFYGSVDDALASTGGDASAISKTLFSRPTTCK